MPVPSPVGRPCAIAPLLLAWGLLLAAATARAQDALRGAELYMQLPSVPSCVSCHGPDPAGNRNNLLKAADQPQALLKALNAIGPMGYLKPLLDEAAVADLAAFLGSVSQVANPQSALAVWPLTADFGTVGWGSAAGPQLMRVRNRSATPIALNPPVGSGTPFAVSHDCPALLLPAAACTVSVVLIAVATGRAAGSISIASDATPAPVVVALNARVQTADGGVLSWLPDQPAGVDMGSTPIGSPNSRSLTLINGGTAPTVLTAASLISVDSAPFTLGGCVGGTVLMPSNSCVVTLHHRPSGEAVTEAMLQVRSDGANPPALVVQGRGTAASAPAAAETPTAGGGAVASGWLWALCAAWVSLAWRRPECRAVTIGASQSH